MKTARKRKSWASLTFTLTRDPPYITSILFTRVKLKIYATVEIHLKEPFSREK